MNLRSAIESETPEMRRANPVSLPVGILGFEHLKHCLLVANPGEAPFVRLQAQEDPTVVFLVVEPAFILPTYQPDIPEQDVQFLGLHTPEDAQLFNIVTIHGPGRATMNLKGPVVFNRHTGVGKQVIPNNAAEFSVQHPLPVVN
jgi:flagellar assembly factor FliW